MSPSKNIIIIVFLLLLAACTGQTEPATVTKTAESIPTATPLPATPEPAQTGSAGQIDSTETPLPGEIDPAQIKNYLDRLASFGYSGVVLAAQNGKIIQTGSYGLANRETNQPPTDQTLFDIGSVTKLFTAVAVLQLESQGLLKLDDTLDIYFEDVPADKAGITIHNLLSHSSGLDAHHSPSDFEPMTKEEAWQNIREQQLLFPPGEISEYSNSGYTVLAIIIENVSGQSYQDYVKENLFQPANMEKSGFYGDPRWSESDVAQSYIGDEAFGSPYSWEGPYWGLIGNGGIVSTLSDLYQWHLALQDNTLLDETAKDKLWQPYLPLNDEGTVYEGYGWIILELPDQGRVGLVSGGDGFDGMNAHYRYYRDNDLTILTLSNDGRLPGELLARSLANYIQGQNVAFPPAIKTVESSHLNLFIGSYELPSGDRIIVQNNNDNLLVSAAGQDAIALLESVAPEPNNELLTRSQAVLEGFDSGSFEPAYQAYGGELSLADLENFFGAMWTNLENENGDIQRFNLLGLDYSDQGDLAANIEGQFERGSVIFKVYWYDGRIVGLNQSDEYPASTQFWPQSDTTYVSYDLFNSETRTIHFIIEDGHITSLTISTPNGQELTAEKKD